MVLQGNRIDLLAEVVLGYTVSDHHRRILVHQAKHQKNLILVFRGAGKTTMATVTRCIFLILKNPNIRILIASKTALNAQDMLKEIKKQFETNERLIEIFGNFVGTEKWSDSSIEVRGRTIPAKEPTINTVGVEGATASKHYDVILGDDLVDEDNSRTKYLRDKMLDWYYKVLTPTLMLPDGTANRGEMSIIGTRYHWDDLYGHLQNRQDDGSGGEMHDSTLSIPALDDEGVSAWPDKFPSDELIKLKRNMSIIRFNSQYQCDCEAMKGAIFRYDDCRITDAVPAGLRIYMGCDLAIAESEESDMFALVALGHDPTTLNYYTIDYFEGHLRFPEQTSLILEWARKYKPIRVGLEINAYQKAQMHQLKKLQPDLNILPITTLKDKVTRAWNLAPIFETGRVWFKPEHDRLREHLVLFPGHRYKDLFDAFDMAVAASKARVRKHRKEEPGLI